MRDRCVRPASAAYCHRGAARARGAAPLPAPRHAVHDLVPHPVSAVSAGAIPHSALGVLLRTALVPCRGGAVHGQHRLGPQGLGFARIQKSVRLAPRSRYGRLQTAVQGVPDARAPHRRVRRKGGRGKEHRCVPANALERQQDRHRRRPRTRAVAGPASRNGLHGLSIRTGSCAPPRGSGRHGVPQPYRYVRPRQSRGHGLRRAGGGFSSDRADRRHRGRGDRGARSGLGGRRAAGAETRSADLPGTRAKIRLGRQHARI